MIKDKINFEKKISDLFRPYIFTWLVKNSLIPEQPIFWLYFALSLFLSSGFDLISLLSLETVMTSIFFNMINMEQAFVNFDHYSVYVVIFPQS